MHVFGYKIFMMIKGMLYKKFTKYSLAIVISLTMLFSCTFSVFAADSTETQINDIVPVETTLSADYINELAEEGAISSDEIILVMKENVDEDSVTTADDEISNTITIGDDEKAVVVSTSDNLGEAIESYNDDPDVLYAQPNYLYYSLDNPNDADFSNQWALQATSQTRVNQAWGILPTKQEDVKVAVIDSGLKNTMGTGSLIIPADLASNIVETEMQDFSSGVAGSNDITDDNTSVNTYGHGTHVAGIIAATANNGIGVAGVSYNRAKVIPYKVFKNEVCSTASLKLAYAEAIKDGCKVINLSLGSYFKIQGENTNYTTKPPGDLVLEAAINDAYEKGVITVASAGNGNTSDYLFPSDYDNVISVVATTNTNERATYSDYNQYKDIAAPGSGIYSTIPGGFGSKTGTSMASPYICGVIALIWSSYPDLTPDQIKDILYTTATDKGTVGRDDYYGYGLVNAEAALIAANTIYNANRIVTGWIYTSGQGWKYVLSNGAVATGWQYISGSWYYLNNSTGIMASGWQYISGKWYYLGSADSGVMMSGWQYISGGWYYLGSANSGMMQTGWQYISGKWYYLGSAGSGKMVTGKIKISGKTYQFNSSGVWIK
jgi:subtilisin family serine protease